MEKFRVEGQEVRQLINYLAAKYDVKIVMPESLLDKKIYLNLGDTDLDSLMKMIARVLSTKMIKEGDLYYIGDLRDEDQSYFVSKIYKYDQEEIIAILQTFSSEKGKTYSTKDGLLVVSDIQESISRVVSFLSSLENISDNVWFVQLFLVDLSDNSLKQLGIQTENLFEVSQILGAGSNFSHSGFIKATLKLDTQNGKRNFKNSVSFLLKDGSAGLFKLGGQYPIRTITTNAQTGNTEQQVQFIDIGQNYNIAIREASQDSLKINLNLSITDIVQIVDSLPILGKREFLSDSIYKRGGLYLAGSIDYNKETFDKKGHVLPLLFDQAKETTRLRIFLKIDKIKGFVNGM